MEHKSLIELIKNTNALWTFLVMVGGIMSAIWAYAADLPLEMRVALIVAALAAIVWGIKGVLGILDWWRGNRENPVNGTWAEFLNRSALERKYPADVFLKYGNEVYLCWLSGQGVLTRNEDDYLATKCIKMLLLPDPKADYVETLWESADKADAFNYPQQIKNTTVLARKHKIPVRWVKSYVGANITVVNPGRNDGYVNLEPCLPFVQPNNRKSVHLDKAQDEKQVLEWFTVISKIFNNKTLSREPQPEELV